MEASRQVVAETVPQESGLEKLRARDVLDLVDNIIDRIYLPFRGQEGYQTERAILVEEPNVPHRENDAEHSWHVAFTCLVLYQNRESLGLTFPEDFDVEKMLSYAVVHDVPEIHHGDVDAMERDPEVRKSKSAGEKLAALMIAQETPRLGGAMSLWLSYDKKNEAEAQFVSDVDKIVATRIIYLDNGRRWHEWGFYTTRERMCAQIRVKLQTPLGHALFDAIEADLDSHPHVFPDYEYPQERLF